MDSGIFENVKKLVAEKLNVDAGNIKPETSFVDDLGADSLDLMDLIMALEDNYSVKISDEEAQKLRTVGEAVDFIESKKG